MALSYEQLSHAISAERLPVAVLDLDALDRNLERHLVLLRGRGTPLRVASKSVRVPAVLRRLQQRGEGVLRGLLCFSAGEAALLLQEGFDDLLVGYPIYRAPDIELLAKATADGHNVSVAVDSEEGLEQLSRVSERFGVRLRVVLCLDMSYELLGGRVHLGVRRSPLRTPEQTLQLARKAEALPGVRMHGLLAYEAQVAGLGDDSPYDRASNGVKALLRKVSMQEVAVRRSAIVARLRAEGIPLAIINGGGVGSLTWTTPETGVNEVSAGSGFYKPHLFDYYRAEYLKAMEPSLYFALEITRRPAHDMVTCLGGGYVSSGSAGLDKVPRPWLPEGLELLPMEQCGEVQTPLRVPSGRHFSLGDPVFFRPSKAGEWAERFRELLFVQNDRIVAREPTYRGLNACFF